MSNKYRAVLATISCVFCHHSFSSRWFADHKCPTWSHKFRKGA